MARATIQDVAKQAGVSIKTVSRVANKEPNVRDQTREKVQRVIDRLDYRPNPSARSLAATKSYVIGLMYDNPSASYLINVQNGALHTSRAEGYDVVIYPCSYQDPRLVSSITSMIASKTVDGLILTPPLSDMQPLLAELDRLSVNFVLIAPADHANAYRSVFTNDQAACADMVRYLGSLGHRRIGFVVGHKDHKAVLNRYLGYRDGLRSLGLKFDRRLVRQGDNAFESGSRCARGLLELSDPPTAIFASNDDMAAGVMQVAHEMGLSIPGDLSVAGFDDVPLASYIWPSLTTIRQPIEEMAVRATALLLSKLRDGDPDTIEHTIDSELIIRASTGAPAGKRPRAAAGTTARGRPRASR